MADAPDEPEPVRRGREVLARTVGEFADPAQQWELVIKCAGPCARQRRLVADLVPVLSPTLTWAEALANFRCRLCGASAGTVELSGP